MNLHREFIVPFRCVGSFTYNTLDLAWCITDKGWGYMCRIGDSDGIRLERLN